MRVAVKVAYDGRPFHGFQVQPDVRTVEGEILRAMSKAGVTEDPRAARLRSASRTDAGVSALGNVIAFDTESPMHGVLPALNVAAKDVWFLGVAQVPDDFNPRHARSRWYRYHLMDIHDVVALGEAAELFVGTHDFSTFAKGAPSPSLLTIGRIGVSRVGDVVAVDLVAQRFLWHMVRRIVAAIVAVERGEAAASVITAALTGDSVSLGSAPPEPLFLMEVDCGIRFATDPAAEEIVAEQLKARRSAAMVPILLLRGVENAAGRRLGLGGHAGFPAGSEGERRAHTASLRTKYLASINYK